jgi:group I intron endonuclease
MNIVCGIYGWKNVVNGKWYIGQSVNVYERKCTHLQKARRGRHHNAHFQSAFTKYGENSFEFYVLEEVPENLLDIRERAYIRYYKSLDRKFGYNLDEGGHASRHFSPETRLKISKASMGNTNMLGKKFSKEHKRRLSESKMGDKYWA